MSEEQSCSHCRWCTNVSNGKLPKRCEKCTIIKHPYTGVRVLTGFEPHPHTVPDMPNIPPPPPAPAATTGAAAPLPVLMPTDAAERKRIPLYSGLMAYFPDALIAVARVSHIGNEQHHPGTALHWDKSKSADEPDALLRHMAGQEWDIVAWRALANLQRKIDAGWRPAWAKKEAGQ